jgi:hypothetical protein
METGRETGTFEKNEAKVRSGPNGDMAARSDHVRFTPDCGSRSGTLAARRTWLPGQRRPRDVPSGTQAGVPVLFQAKHIAVKNAVFEIVRR